MIQANSNNNSEDAPVKAVGLISGGLDSTIAAKIVKDLGVDVHGVYFAMPWGCCDKANAVEAAMQLGIKFIVLQLDERYLEIVRNPKHGYGSQMNPCVDCRIHMFSRAAQYMREIGADFVFTGEVLGQRQMSQQRHSMRWIEEGTGLTGRLLRPLSAQLMEPTIAEVEGKIDRNKLLSLNGRSRTEQIRIANEHNITSYSAPAGGCLLTDEHFARRMKDTLDHGYRTFRETISLKWGRHFRIDKDFKAVLGRDHEENEGLLRHAHADDHIILLPDNMGPTLILKGYNPSDDVLALCGGLIQRWSKHRHEPSVQIKCWPVSDKNNVRLINSQPQDESYINQILIQ